MNESIYLIFRIIRTLLTILTYAIVIQAVLSWVQPDPNHVLVRWLRKLTDPILRPLGRIIPIIGGMDFTPVVAIIIIQLIQGILPALLGAY